MAKAGEVGEATRWKVHGERVVDGSRRGRLSVVEIELPDGVRFEQYVLRLPKGVIVAVVRAGKVLMMWRHRFVIDRWVWDLPGGYADEAEDLAVTAAREVEEETGWRPGPLERLLSFQPMVRMSRVSWNFGDDPCAVYAAAPTVSGRCAVFGWVCRCSAAA